MDAIRKALGLKKTPEKAADEKTSLMGNTNNSGAPKGSGATDSSNAGLFAAGNQSTPESSSPGKQTSPKSPNPGGYSKLK